MRCKITTFFLNKKELHEKNCENNILFTKNKFQYCKILTLNITKKPIYKHSYYHNKGKNLGHVRINSYLCKVKYNLSSQYL